MTAKDQSFLWLVVGIIFLGLGLYGLFAPRLCGPQPCGVRLTTVLEIVAGILFLLVAYFQRRRSRQRQ
jgi:hypothetical protein